MPRSKWHNSFSLIVPLCKAQWTVPPLFFPLSIHLKTRERAPMVHEAEPNTHTTARLHKPGFNTLFDSLPFLAASWKGNICMYFSKRRNTTCTLLWTPRRDLLLGRLLWRVDVRRESVKHFRIQNIQVVFEYPRLWLFLIILALTYLCQSIDTNSQNISFSFLIKKSQRRGTKYMALKSSLTWHLK